MADVQLQVGKSTLFDWQTILRKAGAMLHYEQIQNETKSMMGTKVQSTITESPGIVSRAEEGIVDRNRFHLSKGQSPNPGID